MAFFTQTTATTVAQALKPIANIKSDLENVILSAKEDLSRIEDQMTRLNAQAEMLKLEIQAAQRHIATLEANFGV